MNAVRKHITAEIQAKQAPVRGDVAPKRTYDSPEQEKIAQYVLNKHRVALRALAK